MAALIGFQAAAFKRGDTQDGCLLSWEVRGTSHLVLWLDLERTLFRNAKGFQRRWSELLPYIVKSKPQRHFLEQKHPPSMKPQSEPGSFPSTAPDSPVSVAQAGALLQLAPLVSLC